MRSVTESHDHVEIIIADGASRGIRVEVTDDGIGMPKDDVTPRDHRQFGLIGMRERVMAMAGSFRSTTDATGRGWRSSRTCQIPVRSNQVKRTNRE